jgi:hypothetical protein
MAAMTTREKTAAKMRMGLRRRAATEAGALMNAWVEGLCERQVAY